ncbi:hypothetical protein SCUCBS95973_005950 [Sporothrix curviconia]|uniref:Chitin deacetylase n=1 Tax=Sporothrix curviconia TaxID=1260050 RepID=A0ABP0C3E1_9PEZI
MYLSPMLGVLASAAAVLAHNHDDPEHKQGHNDNDSVNVDDNRASYLVKRGVHAGGGCGTQNSNAVCAAGLCCSDAGVCGTGGAFCTAPACQISACDGNQTPAGADTSSLPRPLFGGIPYGIDIRHCTVHGNVALTFDDGPYLYAAALLDILQHNNVTATCFVVGNDGAKGMINNAATGYPATLRRMVAEGHQVGSHTWSHQDLSLFTAAQRRDQIVKNEIALSDVLGVVPTYLRPPYTRWTQDGLDDLRALGYHVLNYDIDTCDWQGDYSAAKTTYSTALSQHSPSSSSWISLEHDIYNTTVYMFAQYLIDTARRLNYQLPVDMGVLQAHVASGGSSSSGGGGSIITSVLDDQDVHNIYTDAHCIRSCGHTAISSSTKSGGSHSVPAASTAVAAVALAFAAFL